MAQGNVPENSAAPGILKTTEQRLGEIQEMGDSVGGHISFATTIFVLVARSATGTAEADGTHRESFKFIETNGLEEPLPYTHPVSPAQILPPAHGENSFPTGYILGLGAGNMTALQSGKERWCVSCHDEVPSVRGQLLVAERGHWLRHSRW